jgi:hypothetical protein
VKAYEKYLEAKQQGEMWGVGVSSCKVGLKKWGFHLLIKSRSTRSFLRRKLLQVSG